MKQKIRNLANILCYKHIDEDKLNVETIELKKSEVSFFNLSSNEIISFTYEGKVYYFRKCPILYSKENYFKKSIKRFFESLNQLYINPEHFKQEFPINLNFTTQVIDMFKEYIDGKCCDRVFIKHLSEFDYISYSANFSIWNETKYDVEFFSLFGLGDVPKDCIDIAIYFIWNMRSVSSLYRTINITKGKKHSFFSAVKAISSQIVAEELGLEHLITTAKWCNIDFGNGESLFGLLSNCAEGSRMIDSNIQADASLQRELLNLNLLDVICHQTDHGPNNYNIYQNNGEWNVCAFDNDNPSTFFPIFSIDMVLSRCSPFVNKSGIINRPYMDKDVSHKLLNLDIKRINNRLKPYLNFIARRALIKRIQLLQKAVIKTKEGNNSFLLAKDDFNELTIKEELSGKYGMTYLGISTEKV